MKKTIVINFPTEVNKLNRHQIVSQVSFLNAPEFNDADVYCLSFNTIIINTLKHYLPKCKLIFIPIKDRDFNNRGFCKLIDEIKNQLPKKIDHIFFVGGLLSKATSLDKIFKEYKTDLDKFDKGNKFVILRNRRVYNSLVYLVKNGFINCEFSHIVYDPQEAIYGSSNLYFYNYNELQYFPHIDYQFLFLNDNLDLTKTQSFVFGTTCVTEDRREFEPLVLRLMEEPTFKTFYRTKFLDMPDTTISYLDYAKELQQSKYTLIIPSYAKEHYSVIRTLEAIKRNCIPLLYHCNIEDVSKIYPELFQILSEHCVVTSAEDVVKKVKNLNYQLILNKILTCKDIKDRMNSNFYSPYFRNFINGL